MAAGCAAVPVRPQQTSLSPSSSAPDAQREFVQAAAALLPDWQQSCQLLQAAAANATYAHPMHGFCALTEPWGITSSAHIAQETAICLLSPPTAGRKFPVYTARAAFHLFRSSCPPGVTLGALK